MSQYPSVMVGEGVFNSEPSVTLLKLIRTEPVGRDTGGAPGVISLSLGPVVDGGSDADCGTGSESSDNYETDSDCSGSTGAEDGRGVKHGSYSFVDDKRNDSDGHLARDDKDAFSLRGDDDDTGQRECVAEDDDGVSVELEDGDSNFNADEECSSISVTDSDCSSDRDDVTGQYHLNGHPDEGTRPQTDKANTVDEPCQRPIAILSSGDVTNAETSFTCDIKEATIPRNSLPQTSPVARSSTFTLLTQPLLSRLRSHGKDTSSEPNLSTLRSRPSPNTTVQPYTLKRPLMVSARSQSFTSQQKPSRVARDSQVTETDGRGRRSDDGFIRFVEDVFKKTLLDTQHKRCIPGEIKDDGGKIMGYSLSSSIAGSTDGGSGSDTRHRSVILTSTVTDVIPEEPVIDYLVCPDVDKQVNCSELGNVCQCFLQYEHLSDPITCSPIQSGETKMTPDLDQSDHLEVIDTPEMHDTGVTSSSGNVTCLREDETPTGVGLTNGSLRAFASSADDQPALGVDRHALNSLDYVGVSSVDVDKDHVSDTQQNGADFVDGSDESDSDILSNMLSRKPAVRRKGYAWVSKSLPRKSEGDIRNVIRTKGRNYLHTGSSLDLAPSLLNIYDDKAAAGVRLQDNDYSEEEDSQDQFLQKVNKTQSLPAKTNGRWVGGARPGILPSLSEPGDRPVSLVVSDWSPSLQHADSKKRPLSLSSMSSASSSSLPRLRKKRANSGSTHHQGKDAVDGSSQTSEHSHVDSRISVDSGCMDGDKHGDDVSLISSDQASWRDDLDSSNTSIHSASPEAPGATTSSPGKTPTNRSTRSQSPSAISSNSANFRTWTPRNKRTEPTPGSQKSNKSSTSLNDRSDVSSTPGSPSSYVGTPTSADSTPSTTPDSSHRQNRSSRHEARKRFFSNYEEHMKSSSGLDLSPQGSHQPLSPSSSSTMVTSSLVQDRILTSTQSLPTMTVQSEILREERLNPPQHARRLEIHGGRESPSHAPKRTDGRSSRKEKHGSPNALGQKSASGKSTKRKDAGISRDSAEASPCGGGYVSYVQRVVTEIIESERTYISSLKDIIQGYLKPFEAILNSKEEVNDIECLFGNIREIYKFGCAFLTDLEATGADAVKVAECFVKHNQGFVIYADYCTNYPRAVDILTKFMKHPERSELCKERQLSLGHGLPLGAYLLRPVQRILKYHLLLQNIVKNYEKEGKELEILQKAFHHMTEMAHHINEMKRRHEHAVRIQEIQSQLEDYVGEDLTRLGELVLESTFRVYGAKASRQVFLFERGLLISKKTDGGMLSCKTFILCSNLMLVEVIPNEPLSFHIIPFDNPRAQYTLQARNMEQKRKWCQEIKRLILESFKGKIPDSVKSLVMQLGSNHDDDYITKEALEAVRKTQHTAPEYLEKRRFRRKSGSRLPDFSLLKPQKAKKGVNKKTENKTMEMARRAESKSPDARRRLIPQNAIKRRSHSHSVLVLSPSTSELLNASADISTSNPASPSTDLTGPLDLPQTPSVPKEESSSKSKAQKQTDIEKEKEAELIKRAQSFRNAMRSHPITSADLTEIVTRCGGSVHLAEPDNLAVESGGCTSFIDSPETSLLGLRSIDSSSDEDLVDSDQQNIATKETEEAKHISDAVVNSVTQQSEVLNINNAYSASVPVLNNVNADINSTEEEVVLRQDKNNRISSGNNEPVNGQKGKSRLSRRDQLMVKKRHKENEIIEDGNPTRRVMAFHDSYSKRVAEKAILRNKGLRLPNTSKHLSVPGCEPQNSAKLTDWNSVEKLTAGSLNDLSHLQEDPWVMNIEMTSSESSMDTTSANRSNSFSNNILTTSQIPTVNVTTRPRGHSDLTEMMQVATNRENLDWLVYLNRNSLSTKSDINNSWSSVLEKDMKSWDILSHPNSAIHHLPYATPPRSFMTSENMKKHNYMEDSNRNSYQKKSGVNAFGGMPQTVKLTKPTVFHVPGLTRSNSTPLATTRTGKPVHERRPSSMDVDILTDESNRMVAEMEEYISNSSEEIKKSTNKFPTSLPTITVEEDANNNRLSVVSSASSYESQDSSSSDGLVGTLKHKLHVWANHAGGRRDSEQSHSSTLTSEDEEEEEDDTEEAKQFKSGNTFSPPSNSRTSWRESRDLENVLREHSLGSSSLGSRMAHALPQKMIETEMAVTPPDNHAYSIVEVQPPISSTPEDASSQNCSSLNSTKDATESLCIDHDIPAQSSSAVTSQSSESRISTTVPFVGHIPEPVMDFSEDSSKEATPKTKPKFNPQLTYEEHSNLRRESSMESMSSIDSFYERRFSTAIDSDVFIDKPSTIKQAFDESQASLPRKSIREYVQHIEQKFKPQSPKILEVKRKEPGAMIRQRLETLRENIMHGRHRSFSRQSSEERESSRAKSQPPSQHRNKLPIAFKTENRWNDDLKMYNIKTSNSRDSLTRSLENLSRSKDNLTRSRDILTFDFENLGTPGHEKDASRFIYMNLEQSGNQFIHRTPSTSEHKQLDGSSSLSQSMCRLDQLSSDLDNLVIMKGWVKALISKFQEKESN